MVLAVETDNAKVCFGLFLDGNMVCNFSIAADLKKTSDEYLLTVDGIFGRYGVNKQKIQGAVISSVVPQLTDVIVDVIKKLAKNINIVVLGRGSKSGFPIKVDNPSELGGDIVANVAAAIDILKNENKRGTPCIVIDMGTAGTLFAINQLGELVGGVIIPGLGMSVDALHNETAQLPPVSLIAPSKVIVKNTKASVCAGIIYGNAFMIDGFIDKFCEELQCENNVPIFITGEYAKMLISVCSHKMIYLPELTLKGLYCVYKNNIR